MERAAADGPAEALWVTELLRKQPWLLPRFYTGRIPIPEPALLL